MTTHRESINWPPNNAHLHAATSVQQYLNKYNIKNQATFLLPSRSRTMQFLAVFNAEGEAP